MDIIIAEKKCRANSRSTLKKLEAFLKANRIPDHASEPDVRRALLPFVEDILTPSEWILYDGNSIWDIRRLTRQFKTFIKYYDYHHFDDYLYEFFHLQCGSIAHYNKAGWLSAYPTLDDLKNFFKSNEYGQAVKGYQPDWYYDAKKAAETMNEILFKEGLSRAIYPRY